jgi:hypothetical protein
MRHNVFGHTPTQAHAARRLTERMVARGAHLEFIIGKARIVAIVLKRWRRTFLVLTLLQRKVPCISDTVTV